MLDVWVQPAFWAGLVFLIGMEIALSADNVVFIAAMVAKLPEEHRQRVLRIAMVLAAVFRLVLLLGVMWMLGLERTAFTLAGWSPSWRQLILLAGGLFLVYKAVTELLALVEPRTQPRHQVVAVSQSLTVAVVQIVLINAVFSVDSIITAIGVTPYFSAMAIAVVVSVAFLYFAAEIVGGFIARHPAIKALALGFLLVVGTVLVAEGAGFAIGRAYLYWAMGFAALVLLGAKLIQHFTSPLEASEPGQGREPDLGAAPAVAVPPVVVAERRQEPILEPIIELPQKPAAPQPPADFNEPVIRFDDDEEPVWSDEEEEPSDMVTANALADELETDDQDGRPAAETGANDPDATGGNVERASDEQTLGETAPAVPKSRPKPTTRPARALRRRTGRRRE